jgi:hypothetical protein
MKPARTTLDLPSTKPGPKTLEGRRRIAAAARESACLRWAAVKASFDQTRLGEISAEGMESLRAKCRAASTGRKASPETRAKISKARNKRERDKFFQQANSAYRFRTGGRQWT